jgi:hypothetical protein
MIRIDASGQVAISVIALVAADCRCVLRLPAE